MATTTNYSWTTPDDTALVKDGAAAIRSLGTAIDSTVFTNASNAIAKTIVDAKGDLIVASGADAVARLAVGTNDYVLTADSAATNGVKWAALPASGGLTLITETVASANSGIDFNSISGSYKQLLLTWCGVYHSATGSSFYLRFNGNSGSVYGVGQTGDSTTVDIYNTRGAAYNVFGQNSSSTSIEKTLFGSCLIDNYASSTKAKFYEINHSIYDNLYAAVIQRRTVGWFNDTTAITSLNIVRDGGSATLSNAANTSIRLYGIS